MALARKNKQTPALCRHYSQSLRAKMFGSFSSDRGIEGSQLCVLCEMGLILDVELKALEMAR
jgi:hypothetical protein